MTDFVSVNEIAMNPPFTREDFFRVFVEYNQSVWPMQVGWVVVALGAVWMALKSFRAHQLVIGSILGVLWIWMGLVYHIIFFSTINPVARVFGALVILQGIGFIWVIAIQKRVQFHFQQGWRGYAGVLALLYALLIYPLLNILFGHPYPANPTFGLPCPTTIFTLGLLMLASSNVPWWLMVIPLGWCVIGTSAALMFGVWEDLGLVATGLLFILFTTVVKPSLTLSQAADQ